MATRLILFSLLLCTALGCRISDSRAPIQANQAEISEIRQVAFHQEAQSELSESRQQSGQIHDPQVTSRSDPESALIVPIGNQVASLDEVLATAIAVNPAIRKLEAKIEALNGKHCQAGLCPNPTIGISGQEINEGGSPGRYSLYYGNRIVRGNKLGLDQNIVANEIHQAEIELVELRQRLNTDVKLRYYDVLIAGRKFDVAVQLVSLSQNAVEATRQLLEAKEIARTALIQAELEMQNALIQQSRAKNELTGARRNLAALIGEDELPYESLSGTLAESDSMVIENEFEKLLSESPELARLYAQVDVARSNLARQRVEPIGDVSWQTIVGYDFATDDIVSGFQIGLPIPKFNQNQGAICQARQEVIAAANNVEMRLLQLRQKLVRSYQSYQDAKLQVDAYEASVLPKSRESLELITEGFRKGEVDFLQLLTAQRTYFQVNLAVIEQQGILWRQRIGIEGLLLSGSLEPR